MKSTWLSIALIALLYSPGLHAQSDDRQSLVQQIDELRKKLEEMDQRLKIAEAKTEGAPAPQPAVAAAPPVLAPAPLPPTVQAGSQRPTNAGVAAGTIPRAEANSVGLVTVGPGGFTVQSADDNFLLRIGADLQIDLRTFTGTGSAALTDQI